MALSYDQISGITQKHFIPKLVDSVFDSDILLNRAKSKGWYKSVSGGTQILAPVIYALTSSAGWYSGAETLATVDNEQFTTAAYDWKQEYVNISISGIDELKNAGDAAVVDFVKAKTQVAEKTLADILGDGIYSNSTNPKSIIGLRTIVDSANTVGGIDQSLYSWWQGQEDGSTTTLTLGSLLTMHSALSINQDSPSIVTATRANYNRFWSLLQPQQRFVDKSTADAGFANLQFNGVPFVISSKCPASHIFMLNEKYLSLWYHSARNMKFEPFQKPIDQDVKSAKVFWAGAFGTDCARMHGKFTAVAA